MEYVYKARDARGELHTGRVSAASRREAMQLVIAQNTWPISLHPVRTGGFVGMWWNRRRHRRDVMLFCRQLAVMVNAGPTVGECVELLARESNLPYMQRILGDLYAQMQGGRSLSEAMEKHTAFFPALVVKMIQAGELSGSLEIMLDRIAFHLENQYKAEEKLLTILLYPCVLLVVTGFMLLFLLKFVLPVFSEMFAALHTTLPLPTRMILGADAFLGTYGALLMCMLPASVAGSVYLYRSQASVREAVDRWLLQGSLVGKMAFYSELMHISGILSVLLANGVVLDQALIILHDTTQNAYMKTVLRRTKNDVMKGISLSKALRARKIIPPLMLELVAAGDMTGELENMLDRVAAYCRMEVDTLSERIRVLLEPLMLLFIGGLVALIVFAIALPVLDSMMMYAG